MEFERARLERAAVTFNRHFPASQSRILPKIDKEPEGRFLEQRLQEPEKKCLGGGRKRGLPND